MNKLVQVGADDAGDHGAGERGQEVQQRHPGVNEKFDVEAMPEAAELQTAIFEGHDSGMVVGRGRYYRGNTMVEMAYIEHKHLGAVRRVGMVVKDGLPSGCRTDESKAHSEAFSLLFQSEMIWTKYVRSRSDHM